MRSLGISVSDAAAYALLDDFEDAYLAFTVITLSEEREIDCEQGVIHVVPAWKCFLADAGQTCEPSFS